MPFAGLVTAAAPLFPVSSARRKAVGWLALCAAAMLSAALVPGPAQAETIKVAISQRGFWDSSFVDFATREGFFKEAGIEVEPFYTDGGASTLDAVMSGSVDIGMSNGILGVIGRYAKGAPIRVVTAQMTGAAEAFWYARTESGVRSLKDAGGKTVAFSSPGSSTNLMLLALLKQADVVARPTATGGAASTLTQVMTQQIDIGWSVPPFGLSQIEDGKIAIIARGSDVPDFAQQTLRVNVTREEILRDKRELLTRFIKVYVRAIDWAYRDDRSLNHYAEANRITAQIATRTREFYPKEALQVGEIKGLDLTLRDALAAKYITRAMEPKDLAPLFDILHRP
jgi:NitT/TauT family transport system substrate-binding protein